MRFPARILASAALTCALGALSATFAASGQPAHGQAMDSAVSMVDGFAGVTAANRGTATFAHAGSGPGDADAVLAAYTNGARTVASNAGLHYARGLAWVVSGDKQRAIAELSQALRLAPGDEQIAETLARIRQ